MALEETRGDDATYRDRLPTVQRAQAARLIRSQDARAWGGGGGGGGVISA